MVNFKCVKWVFCDSLEYLAATIAEFAWNLLRILIPSIFRRFGKMDLHHQHHHLKLFCQNLQIKPLSILAIEAEEYSKSISYRIKVEFFDFQHWFSPRVFLLLTVSNILNFRVQDASKWSNWTPKVIYWREINKMLQLQTLRWIIFNFGYCWLKRARDSTLT